jgi:hypothetical protein
MAQAWFELGVLYQTGYEIRKDEDKAFECFHKSPEFSANYLGMAYWEGRITKRDRGKARQYLLDAHRRGRIGPDGFATLAVIYKKGLGVPKDPVLAARFSPLLVFEPVVPPAEPKARKLTEEPYAQAPREDKGISVVDIHGLLRKKAPASSWLDYGKALKKVKRLSSASMAFARARALGSAEAEMLLGQLYVGDWGISGNEMGDVAEPLDLDPTKGEALIDSARRRGILRPEPDSSEDEQMDRDAQAEADKFEGQDPRRLFYLLKVRDSMPGC